MDSQSELFIHLISDKTNNTRTIVDSGIGMIKYDLMNNLGIFARSRTKEFMEALTVSADASGSFTITRDIYGKRLGRGTKMTLYLKEDQLEYLEERQLKDLVKKHLEFISYPISLWVEKTTEKEVDDDEEEEEKKEEEEGKIEEIDEESVAT
eukprot:Gb_16730 [translate_table: standard]